MPSFSKISHTSFSVRDAEATATWWANIFGLVEIDRVSGDDWRGILAIHPPSATVLEWQEHDANDGSPFDPARTGLDHLGLKVDSRDELEQWQDHLQRAGVDHTPIADREYGAVLTFRDPDGIQCELFYRADHP